MQNMQNCSIGRARVARSLSLAVTLTTVACGGGGGPAIDGGTDAGDPSARIVLPATRGEFEVPAPVDTDVWGSEAIGEVLLSRGVGRMTILGVPVDALAYEYGSWGEIGVDDLYQTLVVGEDRWYVVWLYCTAGEIVRIWLEGTDGFPLGSEVARGSCTRLAQPIRQAIEFPAVDMPFPLLESGYAFSGADLHYDGVTPGTVVLDGAEMVLLPFESVDCTSCPGGGDTGWLELHAMMYDPSTERACFGVFYMMQPGQVNLTGSICLPDLLRPAGGFKSFLADWSAP